MYQCDICNSVFDNPFTVNERVSDGEHTWEELHAHCPICGEDKFHEVVDCPVCGEPMLKGKNMCDGCKKVLLEKIADFIEYLNDAEIEQLDDWMDGESVRNWRNWK